ncbi:site-specific DNA-methyltransferase [Altererythrobacter sp. Z27]|uniref:site-specific DNA-methyltransferase n=1 Tax=Altererythrobacter sp. Z27 TaxID=3461147 RepID=UPI00404510F5
MSNNISTVSGTTPDLLEELLEELRDLIPSAFPDGDLDVSQLLTALGVSERGERTPFAFTWPGIEVARADARAATTATLVPDQDASLNWHTARDVLIEGDNLQVLKILKASYRGAAKLVYIDPPYNTGNTFTYNDKFSIPEAQYLQESGQVDSQGGATTSKIETSGKKHGPWLTMMFPRLVVARHLLRRDGVFLASIDNNEVHHLRLLLDAVFGADNFVDMMTWQGGRKGDAKLTAGGQDYLLVYARDRNHLKELDTVWRERKTGLEPVYAKEKELLAKHGGDLESAKAELRDWYDSLPDGNPSKAHSHYNFIDNGGVWTSDNSSSPNYRENLVYDFKGYAPPDNGWRYELPRMEQLDAEGRLIYPTGKAKRIRIKKYLREQEMWAPPSTFYQDRSGASSALDTLMGAKVFDDPKSTAVLARLFQSLTSDGDLIVDFFAGSGSTGHAVWEQNAADHKVRQWLLVQAPEEPDPSEESGQTALDNGYETIFEITAERLRRAAKELGKDNLGFRVFRARPSQLVIDKPIIADEETTGQTYLKQLTDMAQGSPVVEGSEDEAVAWELVLKAAGAKLNSPVTVHETEGVKTFEFRPVENGDTSRLFVSLGAFTVETAESLGVTSDDMLILRGDKLEDATTLTLAPRMQKNLILLERVQREVSL